MIYLSSMRTPTIQLQERDLSLLRELFESRLMTIAHIALLYFEGKKEPAKKRVQKLKAAGFIAERRRRANEPSILFLAAKGFALLEKEGRISEFPRLSPQAFKKRAEVSDLTLRHELAVMDCKAALVSAILQSDSFSIAEFSTWPALHQFEAERPGSSLPVLVKPDGFLRIHEQDGERIDERVFFLEVDRSTEVLETLVLRSAAYMDYYRTGGFALRNGATRSDYKEFPFRVLLVMNNAERRNNVALRLVELHPPILTQVWLTTFPEMLSDPLGSIWVRPGDCRQAVSGSRFETSHSGKNYRRQVERERLIEQKIQKLRIFD
jgi:hypothetical protein